MFLNWKHQSYTTMEPQLQKQHFCLILLLELMETVRRLFFFGCCSKATTLPSVVWVKRKIPSATIRKTSKFSSYTLYDIDHQSPWLKASTKEYRECIIIFQLRTEIAILDYGKQLINENSSGNHSKITHNIQYLCAHKRSCEVQVTTAL